MTPAERNREAGRWWDAGPTVVRGCSVVSPGCANCWSASIDHRFGWGHTTGKGKWTGRVTFDIEALHKAVKGKGKVITIWNDLFHEGVSIPQICEAMSFVGMDKKHLFLILTKRIERARYLFKYGTDADPKSMHCESMEHHRLICTMPLSNTWLGTSAESQAEWDERVPILLQTPAAKRFVSVEPLLGPIDAEGLLGECFCSRPVCQDGSMAHEHGCPPLGPDFVIIGCESGPKRRPCKIEWVESLVDQCKEAGVAVWVKQLNINGKVTHKLEEFPESLRLREWPE